MKELNPIISETLREWDNKVGTTARRGGMSDRERNEKLVRELRRQNADPDVDFPGDSPVICAYYCRLCGCEVHADGNPMPGHKHTGEFCKDENNGA